MNYDCHDNRRLKVIFQLVFSDIYDIPVIQNRQASNIETNPEK